MAASEFLYGPAKEKEPSLQMAVHEFADEMMSSSQSLSCMGSELREAFMSMLHGKLDRGREEHGVGTLSLNSDSILDEVEEECVDIAGWITLLYSRLRYAGFQASELSQLSELASLGAMVFSVIQRKRGVLRQLDSDSPSLG